jgi:ribonuclease PH
VEILPGWVETADGSALISVGRTRLVCTASVDETVPPWRRGQKLGWVTAEYGMLPASTGERKAREAARGRPEGRTQEIQRLIGRALRAVTDVAALGERTVWVDCDVVQADGGTRCAAICGAYVALQQAMSGLLDRGAIRQMPLREAIAAVSVGIVDGEARLDLAYEEDSRAEVDMNVVMTGSGRLVEVQATAEGATFDRAALDRLLELAADGLEHLFAAQTQAALATAVRA